MRVHISAVIALGAMSQLLSSAQQQTATQFNYAEALQKSLFFYEAQRSGPLPADNRVSWRGNSALSDGADNNVDLTGGWYDAGDHVKFGLPMSSATTLLAWGALEYRSGFRDTAQMNFFLSNLRWATDYFLKASATPNQLWAQVGDGFADHAWWGPAEVLPMARPSYKVTPECPGSDVAGETAAALAAASLVFQREGDPDYAQLLLTRARSLFVFAETYQGKYSDCISNARAFYNSTNGFVDELAWSAAWLYRATRSPEYLAKAQTYYARFPLEPGTPYRSFAWTHNWDDKTYGTYVLLTLLTGQPDYRPDIDRWLDFWTTGFLGRRIRYTPGGLAWLDQWGSLRYSANTALLALIYSDWLSANGLDPERSNRYRTFAERQLNYMLGDNPAGVSYEAGFGKQPPKNPHHRTAHGSWGDDINSPRDSVHTLYGALVGGPDASDNHADSRSDFVRNEVAIDYNAAFTGGLAYMAQRYGGTPLAGFPAAETPTREELFVEAAINNQGSNFIEIAAFASNQTAWPARSLHNATLRYFFTIPSDNPDDVALSTAFNECGVPGSPQRWSEKLFFVEIKCGEIYPGGQRAYRKQTQFRITSKIARQASTDWSMSGLVYPPDGLTRARNIALLDDDRLVWGQQPSNGKPHALSITTPPDLPAASLGAAYSGRLEASGGVPPYVKWEVASGYLPDGLTLDSSTGQLSGKPLSSGTVSFTGRVTDSSQATADRAFRLPVNPPPPLTITTRSLRSAFIGAAYSVALDATGGIPPYSWAVVAGALPKDFTLTANTVAGTPQAAGESAFTIEASDAAGSRSQRAYVLAIVPAIATTGVKLAYRANFIDAISNQVGPQFKIMNGGSAPIPLSELSIRYYFTLENPQPLNFWCDYAALGCDKVAGRFVDDGQGHFYLEATFTGAVSIPSGGDSGEVQVRFAKADWSNLDQSNDYSFDATKRAYTEWDHITVYRNGVLVWGTPP